MGRLLVQASIGSNPIIEDNAIRRQTADEVEAKIIPLLACNLHRLHDDLTSLAIPILADKKNGKGRAGRYPVLIREHMFTG